MGSKLNDLFAVLFIKDSKSQVKHLEEDKGFSPARAEFAAQVVFLSSLLCLVTIPLISLLL